jgi:hypothetical protein
MFKWLVFIIQAYQANKGSAGSVLYKKMSRNRLELKQRFTINVQFRNNYHNHTVI